ncbi:hypothetical protein AGMMS4957_19620 [Bacteroidia bacterium]|nr:hypothetical protein AGMMS4957_19620 [Bacteroidia bacterium]
MKKEKITIDLSKPLLKYTGYEILELFKIASSGQEEKEPVHEKDYTDGRNVFGYYGIARLLGCSKTMVGRHINDGWIKPAISQRGNKIICDAQIALELYNERKKK